MGCEAHQETGRLIRKVYDCKQGAPICIELLDMCVAE